MNWTDWTMESDPTPIARITISCDGRGIASVVEVEEYADYPTVAVILQAVANQLEARS